MKRKFKNIKKKVMAEMNAKYGNIKNFQNWAIIEEGIDSVLIYLEAKEELTLLTGVKNER